MGMQKRNAPASPQPKGMLSEVGKSKMRNA